MYVFKEVCVFTPSRGRGLLMQGLRCGGKLPSAGNREQTGWVEGKGGGKACRGRRPSPARPWDGGL